MSDRNAPARRPQYKLGKKAPRDFNTTMLNIGRSAIGIDDENPIQFGPVDSWKKLSMSRRG